MQLDKLGEDHQNRMGGSNLVPVERLKVASRNSNFGFVSLYGKDVRSQVWLIWDKYKVPPKYYYDEWADY